jgi:predicted nucleic acid-binding protein
MHRRAVIDASVLAAVFLLEEGHQQWSERLGQLVKALAPHFCRFEVGNTIWKQPSLSVDNAQRIVEQLFLFPLDEQFDEHYACLAMKIAKDNKISFYDAAYIAAAKINSLPLWSLDKKQALVAKKEGIDVFGG